MASRSTLSADERLRFIASAFEAYVAKHPKAKLSVHRENEHAVNVRVIDPAFAKLDWAERHDLLWAYITGHSLEVINDMGILLLQTPAEARKVPATEYFENPQPSKD